MASTSVSVAKNGMARAVDSILDPWPSRKDPIWGFFASSCAYCGLKLVKAARLGHIDHATPRLGITQAISCWRARCVTAMRSATWAGASSSKSR